MKEVLYRTETYSGSGERNVIDVMLFEIWELCNTDILDTLLESDLIKSEELRDRIKYVAEYVDNLDDEDEVKELCEEIISEINKNTGKHIKYAIWLAGYDAIVRHDENGGYGKDITSEADIDKYEIGDVILSDMGKDDGGILYGYEDQPIPINN